MRRILIGVVRSMEIDSAIRWSLFAQMIRVVSGPITAFLVITRLSSTSQGVFYTISSIAALQIIFESGMGQSLLHITSKNFEGSGSELKLTKTLAQGDQERLGPIFRWALKFFSAASGAFLLVVSLVGILAFHDSVVDPAAQLFAFGSVMLSSTFTLCSMAFVAMLEGLQQTHFVVRSRTLAGLASFLATSLSLSSGFELWSIGWGALASTCTFSFCLWKSWGKLFASLRKNQARAELSWRTDIWPFQQKMVANSLCAYVYLSFAIPMVYKVVGPGEAGQLGFVWNMVRSIVGVAGSWTYTKLGKLGQIHATEGVARMKVEWHRFACKGMIVGILGLATFLAGVILLHFWFPSLATRVGSPVMTLILVLIGAIQLMLLLMAHCMHAIGKDGMMKLTIWSTVLMVMLEIPLALQMGALGAAMGMLIPQVGVIILAPRAFQRTMLQKCSLSKST